MERILAEKIIKWVITESFWISAETVVEKKISLEQAKNEATDYILNQDIVLHLLEAIESPVYESINKKEK